MSAETLSIIAVTVSFLSLLITLLSFRRDKYKVKVYLDWDAGAHHVGMRSGVTETWGNISVLNLGRRPIYITLVGLKFPDQERVYSLLEGETSQGIKLSEGDAPLIVKVPHDGLLKTYSNNWKKIYAIALTASGKEYKSEVFSYIPSWVEREEINSGS